ncbi:MAG: alkaline phosphatase [Myxococcaceae bacterium]|nr:alkaline phosphatase [Myxococcaceae bacterium]
MRRLSLLLLLLLVTGCPKNPAMDGGIDAATPDSGKPDAGKPDAGSRPDAGQPDGGGPIRGPNGPVVILMIGDGMGPGQLEAASLFRHGAPGQLYMQSLPQKASVTTSSISGLTDSAAAATTMATGVRTINGYIGVDRDLQPVETLVELAHRIGLKAGVVTTASVPHATPAGFTAHDDARGDYVAIANDQARDVKPDVMLGGGTRFFLPQGPGSDRNDNGLITTLEGSGYRVVYDRTQLDSAVRQGAEKISGFFAPEHVDYVRDRAQNSPQPTLTEMSLAALRTLARSDSGFFLMIEGARIDMASHLNDLPRTVDETLAFDDTIRAVIDATASWPDVVVLVTADHECGGLTVVTPKPAGTLPDVTWRWLQHTNVPVSLFAKGSDLVTGDLDHRWIHALAVSRLERKPLVLPAPILLADGTLSDLPTQVSTQRVATGFGAGYNQLDGLRLGADSRDLALGIEGLFEWNKNAVVVLIDTDFGAGTGVTRLSGALADTTGKVDGILHDSMLDAPMVAGFGAELALVSFGGAEVRIEELIDNAGLRALRTTGNLPWLRGVINFADRVRTTAMTPARPGYGLEAHIEWAQLYPTLMGKVPANATLAITVVLVNDDGGFISNQALPPFAVGAMNPGRVLTALPGVVRFVVDANGDGVPDGVSAATTLP